MKKIIATTFIFIFFYGCESFVENAGSSVSYATDDEISSSENISFLVNGVLNDFLEHMVTLRFGLIFYLMLWLMMVEFRVQLMLEENT